MELVVQGILAPPPPPSRHEIILSVCSASVAVCDPLAMSSYSGGLCDAGQLVRPAAIAPPHFALHRDRAIFPARWCEMVMLRNGIGIGEIIVATNTEHLTPRAEEHLEVKGFKAIFARSKIWKRFR